MNEKGSHGLNLSWVSPPNWLLKTTYALIGTVSLVLILIYNYQDKMLYHPMIPGCTSKKTSDNPPGYCNPLEASGDKVEYEDVLVDTPDGEKIHTWLMLQKSNPENYPTLIYFHGNAGNMGYRLPNSLLMYWKCGMNILTMDYRGYGNSSGEPSERGLEVDAEAVMKYALQHPKLKNSPIVLFGRSLGGAVAVSLAHSYPNNVAAIIIENTFLSISAMVDVLMPWIAFAKNLVLRIGWDSASKVKDLECPILFISGDADELVPPSHMSQLRDLATKSKFKDFYSIAGGGHNDSFVVAGAFYYQRLREFIQRDEIVKFNGSAGSVGECNNEGETNLGGQKQAIPTMQTNFVVK